MSGEKNILILALSTFQAMPLAQLEWTLDDITVSGYYQLEPVPKYLMTILGQQGKKLDEILVFATVETQEEHEITLADGQNLGLKSPLAFFKEQMRAFGGEDFPVIRSIEVDPKRPEPAISTAVTILAQQKSATIYLDTHGGFRSFQLVAESILSVLRGMGINLQLDNIYGAQKGFITREGTPYRMFDFTAGINEFLNYGKITSLQRYLGDKPCADDKALLDCLKEISEGIQMCIIPKFENGLHRLNRYLKAEHDDSGSFLQMFTDMIQSDFGDLLCEKPSPVDELKWCMRKGFYQQALTLIESKVPFVLFESERLQMNERTREKLLLKHDPKKKTREEFLFNRFLYSVNINPQIDNISYSLGEMSRITPDTRYGRKVPDYTDKENFNWRVCANIKKLLTVHALLKSIRNNSNHAQDTDGLERLNTQKLEQCIATYIVLLEGILAHSEETAVVTYLLPKKK